MSHNNKEEFPENLTIPLTGDNFINFLRTAFAHVDPKSVKNTVKSSVFLYAFGIYKRKSSTYNVDEIEP